MTVAAGSKRGRAAWYLARLRAMEPGEVALRARRELDVRLDDAAWRWARPLWQRSWAPADSALFATEPLLEGPLGFLDDGRAARLAAELPDAAAAVVARAEEALAGREALLGYAPVTLDEPRAWNRDPFTGGTWPDRHGKLLDYRRADVGDPKWIWELNRCQELPLLVLAWRLGGDERFAAGALRRLLDWIDGASPGRGIAWSNGFESGLRAISFALAYDGLRGWPGLDATAARAILRALWQHARFTTRDLSPASSANNHIVGELAGLAVVGLLAPELRDAEGFRRSGLAGLAREAERQILPDGGAAEQAFAYHLFVLDLMLLAVAVARCRGVETPDAFRAAFARAADGLVLQIGANEPDPTYGDADDGRAFVLDGSQARTARDVADAIAACSGDPAARRVATPSPSTPLLFGEAGGDIAAATHNAGEPGGGLLANAGLVVLRRSGVRALVDVGPLGYLSIAAHGHADALQVTLADDDVELVIDPGTGSYYGDRDRRAAFRSTAFHATVGVDGLDQAEQAGPFLWREHYRCTLEICDPELGVVVAEHDGYRRLPDPVRHRRAVVMLEDGSVLVYDELESQGSHRYVQTWPLHARLDAARQDTVVEATLDGVPRLVVATAATRFARVDMARGATAPLAGWMSRRLEESEPSWTVRHEVDGDGRVGLAALLVVARGQHGVDPGLAVELDDALTRVTFGRDGRDVVIELDLDHPTTPARISRAAAAAEALR